MTLAPTTTAPASLVRVHWHHPEWVVVAVAAGAWLGLLAPVAADPTVLLRGSHHLGIGGALGPAAVMAAAMMAPLVLAPAHELAVSSLWQRRYLAVVVHLTGYLAAWTLVGLVMMTGLHLARGWVGTLPTVAAAGAAAVVVAGTEDHRRRLRRCGASRPLSLTGWRADRDCLDAGVRLAGRCVATTWALMLALMAQGGLVVLASGTVLMVAERRGLVPDRRLVRWTVALTVLALLVTAGSVGSGSLDGAPVDPHAH